MKQKSKKKQNKLLRVVLMQIPSIIFQVLKQTVKKKIHYVMMTYYKLKSLHSQSSKNKEK